MHNLIITNQRHLYLFLLSPNRGYVGVTQNVNVYTPVTLRSNYFCQLKIKIDGANGQYSLLQQIIAAPNISSAEFLFKTFFQNT